METTILLARHEEQVKEIITSDGEKRLWLLGKRWVDTGLQIDVAVSSPAERCQRTVTSILKGYGRVIPVTTDQRLAYIPLDPLSPPGFKEALVKKTEQQFGSYTDVNAAKTIIANSEFHLNMMRRAYTGAQCMQEVVIFNQGKTVLMCSHGGASLIEPAVRVLCGFSGLTVLDVADEIIGSGEYFTLVFDEKGNLTRHQWHRRLLG